MKNQLGKHVIIRADRAGVFFGILTKKEGSEVQLTEARKLYYWSGASAVEQIALEGVKNPDGCQFTVTNDEVTINNYIQIITCTEEAITNIKKVQSWKK